MLSVDVSFKLLFSTCLRPSFLPSQSLPFSAVHSPSSLLDAVVRDTRSESSVRVMRKSVEQRPIIETRVPYRRSMTRTEKNAKTIRTTKSTRKEQDTEHEGVMGRFGDDKNSCRCWCDVIPLLCYYTNYQKVACLVFFFLCSFLLSIFLSPIPPPGPISFCPMQAIYPPLMHFDLQGLLLEENHRTPPIMQNAIINSLMFGKKSSASCLLSMIKKRHRTGAEPLFHFRGPRGGIVVV